MVHVHRETAAHRSRRHLLVVLVLTGSFLVVEVLGAMWTGSLALAADAGHMLTDVAGVGLALFAIWIASRPPTPEKTFGYYRVEILATVVNALLLLAVALVILIEAYQRVLAPPEVLGGPMMAIAAAGLGVNLVSAWLLHGGAAASLNVRAAYLEVLSDALTSCGVLLAAATVTFTGWTTIDPLVSAAIALFIVPRTWRLLRQAVNILLEGTPAHLELARVVAALLEVAAANKELTAGTVLEDGPTRITVRLDIKPGHKVARRAVSARQPVRRYGQVIGFATQDIEVGDHVHSHNLDIGELSADRYEVGVDVRPVTFYSREQMRYFDGFKREDGRVGTRNYVAIVSTVNCSASVSQFVKEKFRDVTVTYPNIDGVIAVTHKSGCGTKLFGEDHLALHRVLAGYAKHPNVAADILIGLGCEVNQAAVMVERQKMSVPGHPERKPYLVNIQEAGRIRKTVERATSDVARLLPVANDVKRTKQPVS